jgi:hypothetical protein
VATGVPWSGCGFRAISVQADAALLAGASRAQERPISGPPAQAASIARVPPRHVARRCHARVNDASTTSATSAGWTPRRATSRRRSSAMCCHKCNALCRAPCRIARARRSSLASTRHRSRPPRCGAHAQRGERPVLALPTAAPCTVGLTLNDADFVIGDGRHRLGLGVLSVTTPPCGARRIAMICHRCNGTMTLCHDIESWTWRCIISKRLPHQHGAGVRQRARAWTARRHRRHEAR